MDAAAAAHPTDRLLEAHALGQLDGASAASVDSHLIYCAKCRVRAADISSDTFLNRLRDAHARLELPLPAGSSSPGMSATEGLPRATAPPAASSLPPGLADHPDYEILRELGRGGMGVVYLAHNLLMGRKEVLKVVSRDLMDRPSVPDRFLREIRNAAQLHHPNIVTAYSAVRAGESIVFAMEYVEGYDLAQLVKGQGPLPVPLACNFIYQVAQGLNYAHQQGMVHRDIKPSNLILAREANKPIVKVLDFGLAKATREGPADGGLTHEGQMLGTPDYIAPEQALDAQKADIRADIYSLGCTLYYLLSGAAPFRGSSLYEILHAHQSIEAKPLNLVRPEVPRELAAVVAKMMAKEPARRYQTPGEVAQALKPFFKPVESRAPGSKAELSQVGQSAADEPVARSRSRPKSSQRGSIPEGLIDLREGGTLFDKQLDSVPSAASAQRDLRGQEQRGAAVDKPKWLGKTGGWAAAGILLSVLAITWAAGVLKVKTKDGTIVLENVPENAVVEVDGDRVTVTPAEGRGKPVKIEVRPGKHGVVVKRDDVVLMGESVSLEAGKEIKLRVRFEPIVASRPAPGTAEVPPEPPSVGSTPDKVKPPEGKVLSEEPPAVGANLPIDRTDVVPPRPAQSAAGSRRPSFLGGEPPLPSTAHDPSALDFDRGRPMLVAPYCANAPVADGIIQAGEYENAPYVDFTFTPNSRFGALQPGMPDPRQSKAVDDLSVRLRSAYSDKSLFLAIQVRDQFVDDQEEDRGRPQWNDSVEIFLDGDRVSNDYLFAKGGGIIASPEGFQLLVDAAGHQFTTARDFKNKDWKTGAKRYADGYVIEVEVPLALIDVKDGPGKVAAEPGSAINLGLAVNDNDAAVHNQTSYAYIRARPAIPSPVIGREDSWTFGIKLAPGPSEADRGSPPEKVWQPLFNGRDLTGWKRHPNQPGNWRVKNGILVGSGPANSHLYTDRGNYGNFHLRLETRVNEGGNSGVYFRAPFGPTFPANNPQWLAAYNAKIDKNRFGGLIVDGAVGRPLIRNQIPLFQPGQWITLEVIAQGSRIEIKINGVKTADYTDQEAHYSMGHIVLQQHGPRTVAEFRMIEVRDLTRR